MLAAFLAANVMEGDAADAGTLTVSADNILTLSLLPRKENN